MVDLLKVARDQEREATADSRRRNRVLFLLGTALVVLVGLGVISWLKANQPDTTTYDFRGSVNFADGRKELHSMIQFSFLFGLTDTVKVKKEVEWDGADFEVDVPVSRDLQATEFKVVVQHPGYFKQELGPYPLVGGSGRIPEPVNLERRWGTDKAKKKQEQRKLNTLRKETKKVRSEAETEQREEAMRLKQEQGRKQRRRKDSTKAGE